MKLFVKGSERRVMKEILNFKVQQVYTGQLKTGQEAMPAAGPTPPRSHGILHQGVPQEGLATGQAQEAPSADNWQRR